MNLNKYQWEQYEEMKYESICRKITEATESDAGKRY